MQYLKDAFGEGGLLRELLQILGVWIVIGGKVGFEHAQLLVLERRPQPLRLLLLIITAAATIADDTQHRRRCVHQVTVTVFFPFYCVRMNCYYHVIQSSLLPPSTYQSWSQISYWVASWFSHGSPAGRFHYSSEGRNSQRVYHRRRFVAVVASAHNQAGNDETVRNDGAGDDDTAALRVGKADSVPAERVEVV